MEYNQVQQELRTEFLREACESVLRFGQRDDVLAAILTGSAAGGKPNPDGDLDILLITQGRGGVLYRYLIPGFCSVKRRTEMGYIPREAVVKNIEGRFETLISRSMIEQLKNGRVLFQKKGHGDALIESARRVVPGKLVVGKLVGDIAVLIREISQNLDRKRYEEAVLTVRQVARLAVQALLLARENTGVAKEKHEYRAVGRHLNRGEVEAYDGMMGVSGLTAGEARKAVGRAIDLVKWALEARSVSPALAEYYGEKREAEEKAV
jgi:hypothetical protein